MRKYLLLTLLVLAPGLASAKEPYRVCLADCEAKLKHDNGQNLSERDIREICEQICE